MVIPEDQDGKSEDCLALAIQSDNTDKENTRKGGIQSETKVIQKVIVDMREFRSELPAILYTRGIKIEPVTLVVSEKKTLNARFSNEDVSSLIIYDLLLP